MRAIVARSCSDSPVESKTVISSSDVRPGASPAMTAPISSSSAERAPSTCGISHSPHREALAHVVDDHARACQQRGLGLLLAGLVGAHAGDVRAGTHPLRPEVGSARGCGAHDHVRLADGLGKARRLDVGRHHVRARLAEKSCHLGRDRVEAPGVRLAVERVGHDDPLELGQRKQVRDDQIGAQAAVAAHDERRGVRAGEPLGTDGAGGTRPEARDRHGVEHGLGRSGLEVEHERRAMVDGTALLGVVLIAADGLQTPDAVAVEVSALEVHVTHAVHELVEEQRPDGGLPRVLLRVRGLDCLERHGDGHERPDLPLVQNPDVVHWALLTSAWLRATARADARWQRPAARLPCMRTLEEARRSTGRARVARHPPVSRRCSTTGVGVASR